MRLAGYQPVASLMFMPYFDFEFAGQIVRNAFYTVVLLPEEIARKLPFARFPRLRVEGELADMPFEGAWQPNGDGTRYLIVPKRILLEADVRLGSVVEVRFRIGDQDAVDMPVALKDALSSDEKALAEWEKLTSGRKRSFAYRVGNAKSPVTIAARVEEVVSMIRNREFYSKGGARTKSKS